MSKVREQGTREGPGMPFKAVPLPGGLGDPLGTGSRSDKEEAMTLRE